MFTDQHGCLSADGGTLQSHSIRQRASNSRAAAHPKQLKEAEQLTQSGHESHEMAFP